MLEDGRTGPVLEGRRAWAVLISKIGGLSVQRSCPCLLDSGLLNGKRSSIWGDKRTQPNTSASWTPARWQAQHPHHLGPGVLRELGMTEVYKGCWGLMHFSCLGVRLVGGAGWEWERKGFFFSSGEHVCPGKSGIL